MKVKFGEAITNLLGDPILQDGKPLTLGIVAGAALLTDAPKLDARTKVKRFILAQKIFEGGEINLEVEEIAEIKKIIGEIYPPLIVGRSWELLEGED